MFVRVNQADTDMEKAIKLSLKSSDATKDLNIEMNDGGNVPEIQEEAEDAQANFPHVGPTVRKKEERKKLRGFDCG